MRSLRGYIVRRSGDDAASVMLLRRLQLVEAGLKLIALWEARKDAKSAMPLFSKAWTNMITFALQPPAIDLNCKHLWELYYQSKASAGCIADSDLDRTKLVSRGIVDESAVNAFIDKVGVDSVVGVLSLGKVQMSVREELRVVAEAFMKAGSHNVPSGVLAGMKHLSQICHCMVTTYDTENAYLALSQSVNLITENKQDEPGHCIFSLLSRFAIGLEIMAHARVCQASQTLHRAVLQDCTSFLTLQDKATVQDLVAFCSAVDLWSPEVKQVVICLNAAVFNDVCIAELKTFCRLSKVTLGKWYGLFRAPLDPTKVLSDFGDQAGVTVIRRTASDATTNHLEIEIASLS